MRHLTLAIAAATLVGCATNTDVRPATDGNYTVMREDRGFLLSTAELKNQAIGEASSYCSAKKMQVKVIDVKEIPQVAFGSSAKAEVLFTCQ